MNIGVAGICLMNIIWLQAAPTAFQNIGWKFYLCFIIPGCIAAAGIFFYFPDTWGIPLEEVAAIFGASPVNPFIANIRSDSSQDMDELYSGPEKDDVELDNKADKDATITHMEAVA